MIFIFGTRGSTRPAIKTDYVCPACGQEHSVYVVPQQRYFHLFWIPVFPTSKNYTIICTECGGTFLPTKISVTKDIKQQAKTPKWTFFGLFAGVVLLTSFLLFGKTLSDKSKENIINKIENPSENDIYQVKLKHNEYTLYKVAYKTKDSIYFYPHENIATKKRILKHLSTADFLDESDEYIEGYSKSELKIDAEDGRILDVYR